MIKKFLKGLLMMSAAAVISVGVSSYTADAAGITPTLYTVDYANQKITVAGDTANKKIYVAKATVTVKTDKKTGSTVTTVKNAAATEYDLVSNAATIDISSFAVTKDIYLSIWGNVQTDPTLIKLPAATTKMKAVVNAVDSSVVINDVTDAKNPVAISAIEYCTTNGTWTAYTAGAKLTDYAQLGATLRFRAKASASAKLAAAVQIGVDANGDAVKACVGSGNFASNEVKAKIAKTASGPKATIDYSACTIKVPNTSEYRVQAAPGKALGTFTAATGTDKTITLDATTLLTATGAEFDLRTVATDKKPASKITEYTFSPIGTITAKSGTAAMALTSDVTNTVITGEDISVTKVTLNSKTMAGTMTVTNKTTSGYQFIVADAQSATTVAKLTLPTAADKVTGTVAAGKSANIKVKSGQYVYVRKAADTKSMTWATPYIFYGVVMNTL